MSPSSGEDEIKELLTGTRKEFSRGINLLYKEYRQGLLAYIHKVAPGLTYERKRDALTDTFKNLCQEIDSGTFDLDLPVARFLFRAAKLRAYDQLRQQTKKTSQLTTFLDDVADEIKQTEIGKAWTQFASQNKANEITTEFKIFLSELPPVQRQVAQIMSDNFPRKLEMEDYIEEICLRTGEVTTGVKIKSALAQVRAKFFDILLKKGMHHGIKR